MAAVDRGGGTLERLSLNITEATSDALTEAMTISGDSKTASCNKALRTYALLLRAQAAGGAVYMREGEGAELERLRLL